MRLRLYRVFRLFLVGVTVGTAALGASPAYSAASHWEFDHSRWMGRNGAPADSRCFAQTPDEFLWIGSPEGLFRFDGVQFQQFRPSAGPQLVSQDISALYVSRDGDLWVGHRHGGISRMRGGMVTRYTASEGLAPGAGVTRFAQDRQGTIWAATWSGLFRLTGESWQRVGSDSGYEGRLAQDVAVDKAGTLWVASGEEIEYLAPGASRFRAAALEEAVAARVEFPRTADGLVVLMANTPENLKRFPDGPRLLPYWSASVPGGDTAASLVDRDGGLWMPSGDGVYRLDHVPEAGSTAAHSGVGVQRYGVADGLSSDILRAAFEDREGNIWIATEIGIDRFTRRRFEPVRGQPGALRQILAGGEDGAVYVTAYNRPAIRIQRDESVTSVPQVGLEVTASYRDPYGALWVGGPLGIVRREGERTTHFDLPVRLQRPLDEVRAMAMDGEGQLWVSIDHEGIFRLRDGVWSEYKNPFDSAPLSPTTVYRDDVGDIWLGYDRHVVEVKPQWGMARKLDLDIGLVSSIAQDKGTLWLGGENGLAWLRGGSFHSVRPPDGQHIERVNGLVFSVEGDLWANASPGIVRIGHEELAKLLADSGYQPEYSVYDAMALVTGHAPPSGGGLRDDAGNLWFVVADRLFRLRRGETPYADSSAPAVSIQPVQANGVPYAEGSALSLPAGVSSLRITYTAKTLVASDDIVFRYRMEGIDDDWQLAGDRREVTYVALPPGSYRFAVAASRPGGHWGAERAMALSVQPSFVQSKQFLALCFVAVGGLIYLLFWLRLRQLRAVYQIRASAQLAERERIARELHDTLLQGIQGLTLRLGSVLRRIAPGTLHADLERTIEQTESVLIEGRRRVRALRGGLLPDGIARALEHVGEQLAADHSIGYTQTVSGSVAPLECLIEEEMYGVAREALVNAFTHSGGSRVCVDLQFLSKYVSLRVVDDGSGMDEAILNGAYVNDHWGIQGMKERAAGVGGTLHIENRQPHGTVVELRVPARVAYQAKPGR